MSSNCQLENEEGSAAWARAIMVELSNDDWATRPACTELVQWIYAVAWRRAKRVGAPQHARRDLIQDTVSSVIESVSGRRAELADQANPAAALEYLVMHALSEALHDHLMRGYGGATKNGRNSRLSYPEQDSDVDLAESLVAPALLVHFDDRIAAASRRIAEWISANLRIRLTSSAFDATTYALDRMRGGATRRTLVRGGHSSLSNDQAMRFLGFDRDSAAEFASWLLGRVERGRLGVIDSAMLDVRSTEPTRERWRTIAVRFGFAEPSRTPPPSDIAAPTPSRDPSRLIA